MAAHVLAEAGCSVLVVERGRALKSTEIGWDPVRNHRTAVFGFGEGVTPVGNPRAVKDGDGEQAVEPHDFRYHNNAVVLGGGPGCTAAKGGGSRRKRSAWPASTASPMARPCPTGPLPTTTWSPTTTWWNGRWGWPAPPATPAMAPDPGATRFPRSHPTEGGEMLAEAAARPGLGHRSGSFAGQLPTLRREAGVRGLQPMRGPPVPGGCQERRPQHPAPPGRRGWRPHPVRHPGGAGRRRPRRGGTALRTGPAHGAGQTGLCWPPGRWRPQGC